MGIVTRKKGGNMQRLKLLQALEDISMQRYDLQSEDAAVQ